MLTDVVMLDSFHKKYRPITFSNVGGCLIPSLRRALGFARRRRGSNRHVWALMRDSTGTILVTKNLKNSRAIAYIVTSVAWIPGDPETVPADLSNLIFRSGPLYGPDLIVLLGVTAMLSFAFFVFFEFLLFKS